MKRHYLPSLLLMLIAGCASLGIPQADTFNKKEAVAITTVTAIRSTALTLLTSGKISADDAQNIQDQADNAREAIVVADTLHAADPNAGADRLTAIITSLTAIQTYLATRK